MGEVVSVVATSPYATDGVRDHAALLSAELERQGVQTETVVVDWRGEGVKSAFRTLRELRSRRPSRILLHMSHLSWSKRGLPLGFLCVVALCQRAAPTVIWVHDPDRVNGSGIPHRVVSWLKGCALQTATAVTRGVIVAVEPEQVFWATARVRKKLTFCPSPSNIGRRKRIPPADMFTVAMFGNLIGVGHDAERVQGIGVSIAGQIGPYRLRLLGSGDTEPATLQTLRDVGVVLDRSGGSAAEVAAKLAASHVFVAYRYGLSARSGSLAAAVACELPVVGFVGSETGEGMVELGAVLLPDYSPDGLASAVADLSRDPERQASLAAINGRAADTLYSWAVIGARVAAVLENGIHDAGLEHA